MQITKMFGVANSFVHSLRRGHLMRVSVSGVFPGAALGEAAVGANFVRRPLECSPTDVL